MPRVDVSGILAEAQRLRGFPANAKQATKRAVGTLARRLPVEARRDIQNEYALPANRITQDLSAKTEDSAVVLTGYARPVGLIEFGGRWAGRKSQGATARVFVAEGQHNYGGTFIARLKNGNKQIVDRTTKKRLPLKTLYGPSVASMLRKGQRESRLADLAQDVLSAEIARLL